MKIVSQFAFDFTILNLFKIIYICFSTHLNKSKQILERFALEFNIDYLPRLNPYYNSNMIYYLGQIIDEGKSYAKKCALRHFFLAYDVHPKNLKKNSIIMDIVI